MILLESNSLEFGTNLLEFISNFRRIYIPNWNQPQNCLPLKILPAQTKSSTKQYTSHSSWEHNHRAYD